MQRQELHNKLAPAIMLTSKAPPGQVSDHISFNAGTSPLGFTGPPYLPSPSCSNPEYDTDKSNE